MKILIVDDEKITREGIRSSINWDSLGIFTVLEAQEGLSALSIAKKEKPDIILCDIRMPRMDGIQFVEQVRTFLPNTAIIFMSGYSDKDYLKAAIKLRAVNYVEKPLNPIEIEEAILAAKEDHLSRLRNLHNESLDTLQKSSRLASLLTKPYLENRDNIKLLSKELSIPAGSDFMTYIVKIDSLSSDNPEVSSFVLDFIMYLDTQNLKLLYTVLHDSYHIFHIWGDSIHAAITQTEIEKTLIARFRHINLFYIGKGMLQSGISKCFISYASAVVALQSSFFFPTESILQESGDYTSAKEPYKEISPDSFKEFNDLLLEKREDDTMELLGGLYHFYYKNKQALPSQAKGLYFRLLVALSDAARGLSIYTSFEDSHIPEDEKQIIEELDACFSYENLHHLLIQGTKDYFDALKSSGSEDSTINLIRDYISKNYAKESLTIKEISDYVYLSVSYMCTYFKNQTGTTLNQYLTEYRMKKAMQLLKDSRIQISDISSKVGYSNGNYFSKSFKKYTGMSPSQYRENLVK